jgi:hypothetical protein
MKKILQSAAVWLLLATLNAHLATVLAQGTAFTYQGRLNSSGSPASGSYDLVFTLYNTNTAGIAIAEPATNSAVAVTNGLFTTLVDFGPGVFTGTSNWLAIAVSTNGANTFSLLTPRQQVTPTPYALYSANAGTAATASSVPAADVTGTLGLGQLPPAVLTNSATSVSLSGAFIGNGGGLTNIADWHLGGNTGTTNGNYLGTTDNQPLEIRVGGVRAGWISPSNGSPNVVFGPAQNVISNTTAGASILGGINNQRGPAELHLKQCRSFRLGRRQRQHHPGRGISILHRRGHQQQHSGHCVSGLHRRRLWQHYHQHHALGRHRRRIPEQCPREL